jgi:tetrapyrrole methylase family protein/MazG family protein
VHVRTATHETLAGLDLPLRSFDSLYEQAATLQDVYPLIAQQIIAQAQAGESVVYAVPGDPCVAERSVALLRESAATAGVPLRVLSGVSCLEPTLAALGVDVLPSLWLGCALDVAAAGSPPFSSAQPALLLQLHSRAVASELKLTLFCGYAEDTSVALVHAAGDAGGTAVEWLPLHEIDRSARIGARTSLFLPAAARPSPPSLEAVLGGLSRARDALKGPWAEGDPEAGPACERMLAAAQAAAAANSGEERLRALSEVLLQLGVLSHVAQDEGEWSVGDLLEMASEKAGAVAGAVASDARPQAPIGRGYVVDEDEEDE